MNRRADCSTDMSQFEYLAALISIVVAFGLSQVLVAWGRLLRVRTRVTTYWVHSLWSALIVLFMILFWWELWQYRVLDSWTFFTLVWTILNAMFIVLAAYILMPSIDDVEGPVNLRAFYYETSPVFFSITMIGMVSITVSDLIFDPETVHWGETASRLAWLPFGIWVARSQDARVHGGIAVIAILLFVAFVGSTHLR